MAGESARETARRQREKAERLHRSAELWERGADGEQRTADVLSQLPADNVDCVPRPALARPALRERGPRGGGSAGCVRDRQQELVRVHHDQGRRAPLQRLLEGARGGRRGRVCARHRAARSAAAAGRGQARAVLRARRATQRLGARRDDHVDVDTRADAAVAAGAPVRRRGAQPQPGPGREHQIGDGRSALGAAAGPTESTSDTLDGTRGASEEWPDFVTEETTRDPAWFPRLVALGVILLFLGSPGTRSNATRMVDRHFRQQRGRGHPHPRRRVKKKKASAAHSRGSVRRAASRIGSPQADKGTRLRRRAWGAERPT